MNSFHIFFQLKYMFLWLMLNIYIKVILEKANLKTLLSTRMRLQQQRILMHAAGIFMPLPRVHDHICIYWCSAWILLKCRNEWRLQSFSRPRIVMVTRWNCFKYLLLVAAEARQTSKYNLKLCDLYIQKN